jgi:methylmalonyl-CoA mutase cobalamin-binding domain/chain
VEGVTKGTVVIATVYGDVHDIGKNLVKTILANNGYTVIDLGKQVPAETIITKAVEVNATAIGLSALLVSTSKQMPLIVNEMHRRKHQIPVLVGGAAINRRFGRRILCKPKTAQITNRASSIARTPLKAWTRWTRLIDPKKSALTMLENSQRIYDGIEARRAGRNRRTKRVSAPTSSLRRFPCPKNSDNALSKTCRLKWY